MKVEALSQLEDPSSILDQLLENAPPEVIADGLHDYLLVEQLFPSLDESFKTRHLLSDDEVENFKKNFDYNSLGIKDKEQEEIQKQIKNMKSIDRILSIIEKRISEDLKKNIVAGHIKRIWLEQNCKNDLSKFISSLNKSYWNLE